MPPTCRKTTSTIPEVTTKREISSGTDFDDRVDFKPIKLGQLGEKTDSRVSENADNFMSSGEKNVSSDKNEQILTPLKKPFGAKEGWNRQQTGNSYLNNSLN